MRSLLILVLLVFSQAGYAAEFCATTAAELQNHLDTAETNGQSDFIRVATGSYVGNFVYDTVAPVGGDVHDLLIVGGYSEFFGNPCGVVFSPDPVQTVIDGDGTGRALTLAGRAGTKVEVRNLAFISGDATASVNPRGGGIRITSNGNLEEAVVENNLFIGNTADFGGAISILSADFIAIRNNVIAGNTTASSYAVSLVNDVDGIHVINNTIINNVVGGTGNGGLYLGLSGTAQGLIVNNILWGNDNVDLRLLNDFGANYYVYDNSIEEQQGSSVESSGNIAVAPQFESGFFNYTLALGSPMIDAGRTPPQFIPFPPPFDVNWSLPMTDLTGRDRILGTTVDMGAVESIPEEIFVDGFES